MRATTMIFCAMAVLALVTSHPGTASAARAAQKMSLALQGAAAESGSVCGQTRKLLAANLSERLKASVRMRDTRPLPPGGRRAKLTIEQCRDGHWTPMTTRRLLGRGRYRQTRRFNPPLALAIGEFRVRASVAGDRRRRAARSPYRYARVVDDVLEVPVSFKVVNQNRSQAPCPTDGADYLAQGHLVGPRSALAEPSAVTVYLHGLSWAEHYWHFKAVPGYDYATEMGARGHVSLVYDLVGYGKSGRPAGHDACYPSQADIASQIIGQLRAGGYTAAQRAAPAFSRVALASHAQGGFGAEVEAYSFDDIDALMVTSYADQNFSSYITTELAGIAAHCAQGGDASDGDTGPTAYTYTPLTEDGFRFLYFANAEPAVVDAAAKMRTRGPCGEPESAIGTIASNQARLREVKVPVLLAYGLKDNLNEQPKAGEEQKALYSGSEDVTLKFIEGAGSSLALERTAPEFRDLASAWLRKRGF